MSDKPMVLAVATYPNKDAATADFHAVWGLHHEGDLDHVAASVLVKEDGKLRMDRHDTTAKHLAWGGAILGGALAVVAAPFAVVPIGVAVVGGAQWAGVGGLIGHFWHNIPKKDLREMQDLLDEGEAALVVVAVEHTETDISALLSHATKAVVKQLDGDPEAIYSAAVAEATA